MCWHYTGQRPRAGHPPHLMTPIFYLQPMKTTYILSPLDQEEAMEAIDVQTRPERLAPKSTDKEKFSFKGEVNYFESTFSVNRNKRFNAIGPVKGFTGTISTKGSGSLVELKPIYNWWFILWSIGLILLMVIALQLNWFEGSERNMTKTAFKLAAALALGTV